jgi:hypothetical protein
MIKACLIDFIEGDFAVPWMTFETMDDAIATRRTACMSWPREVALIDLRDSRQVPHRYASVRGTPHFRCKVTAYRFSERQRWYEVIA